MDDMIMKKSLKCDLCVVGGGLSGAFAALAAARHGAKVVLMQDRAMLGGNASSEIRMWVRGARGLFNRETGLISELEERNIHGNPTLVHSIFDATLYGMLKENENITLLLNTTCVDAKTEGNRIISVKGWQMTTYTWVTVEARLFADCSGDSILAGLTGAEYRHGREGKEEFGESLAQNSADSRTMGMSILLAARETDSPVKFTPPSFANCYPDDSCFDPELEKSVHALPRDHIVGTSKTNLWWVELGGELHSIYDAEKMRDELLASIYGVWDHIKNHGDHGMENWDLEWVGFLPGKRESRRYVGDYIMTEKDLLSGGDFEDEIAYGGWPIDDHNPYGMRKNPESNIASLSVELDGPYGIPLRSLYSKNIENLCFAGRNISVSHVALSSTRVMATCSLLGQALGSAASVAVAKGISMRDVAAGYYREVQKILLDDGVFLPHHPRETSALARSARVNLSGAEREILFNGIERPRAEGDENGIWQNLGEELCFEFDKKQPVGTLRLRFDPDFSRMSVSDNKKMRVFAMKLHTGKDFRPVRVASSIVKSFAVYADGREIWSTDSNYLSLVKIPLDVEAKEIKIKWHATNGAEKVHLFSADFI